MAEPGSNTRAVCSGSTLGRSSRAMVSTYSENEGFPGTPPKKPPPMSMYSGDRPYSSHRAAAFRASSSYTRGERLLLVECICSPTMETPSQERSCFKGAAKGTGLDAVPETRPERRAAYVFGQGRIDVEVHAQAHFHRQAFGGKLAHPLQLAGRIQVHHPARTDALVELAASLDRPVVDDAVRGKAAQARPVVLVGRNHFGQTPLCPHVAQQPRQGVRLHRIADYPVRPMFGKRREQPFDILIERRNVNGEKRRRKAPQHGFGYHLTPSPSRRP